jgi:uncharacterized membrane protein
MLVELEYILLGDQKIKKDVEKEQDHRHQLVEKN